MREEQRREDLGRRLRLAVEKLAALEDVVLLGNKLYKKSLSPAETIKRPLDGDFAPHIEASIAPRRSDTEVGETVSLEIEIRNSGKAPAFVFKIEEIVPKGLELIAAPDDCDLRDSYLDMHGKKLNPYTDEQIQVTLRSLNKGSFVIAPRIAYVSESGQQMSSEPEPAIVNVSETILPDRVETGFKDLDSLLLGGIPKGYAVILNSVSCDERELLIRRFLETGIRANQVTFYVTIDALGVRSLAEEFQSDFYVFVCNPNVDTAFENLPNVLKLRGVENLTDLNISLDSKFRKIGTHDSSRRACIEIISDVLLQHQATQTRKWLSGLIPQLRSAGFTTLAVMNPYMHRPEETHAILDLFEGEINIYEKEKSKDPTKYLRIGKMYNQRYLESELLLRKANLRSALAARKGRWSEF